MENQEFKELSATEVKDLQYGLRHLLLNYPHDELKKIIWELYRGWVYNSAESVTGEGYKIGLKENPAEAS